MPTVDKLDLYKLHKADYVAPRKPTLLNIAPATYLAITGRGEPEADAFQTGIAALYSVAFTIKMSSKFAGRDYTVCKLEGQWWADKSAEVFSQPKDQWHWKLLIRAPDFISQEHLDSAQHKLLAKGKPPETRQVKLETIEEGQCVQMLHVGPYEAEGQTIAAMKAFAKEQGLTFHGRHHEIYLSDPRRVPPDRLRTILRHPVK